MMWGAEGLRLLEPISQAKRTEEKKITVLLLSGELAFYCRLLSFLKDTHMSFDSILNQVDDVVWGLPTIILILATGFILTVAARGIQFSKLGRAFKGIFKKNEGDGEAFYALIARVSAGELSFSPCLFKFSAELSSSPQKPELSNT